MSNRTPQQVADELLSLQARAVNIVQGTIAGAANPGGRIAFTYTNPIDGRTYTAEGVAWNVCSPSQVSALKLEDGSWVVVGAHESATVREVVHTDRRSRPKEESFGKIQILYSEIVGDERVFYVWGDRPTPKRVAAIPKNIYPGEATIHSQGGGRFIVGLRWASEGVVHFQSIGAQAWKLDDSTTYNRFFDQYAGHGFWFGENKGIGTYRNSFTSTGTPQYTLVGVIPSRDDPTYYKIYKGNLEKLVGTIQFQEGGDIETIGHFYSMSLTFVIPILPNLNRAGTFSQYGELGPTPQNPTYPSITIFRLIYDLPLTLMLTVSKNAQSAVYRHVSTSLNVDINAPLFQINQTDQFRLIDATGETILGGDLPPELTPDWFGYIPSISWAWVGYSHSNNLIGNQYFRVPPPTELSDASPWEVEAYQLGANTTKSTLRARVQYKHKPGRYIHNASYHP